jgi:hypothetical protein
MIIQGGKQWVKSKVLDQNLVIDRRRMKLAVKEPVADLAVQMERGERNKS